MRRRDTGCNCDSSQQHVHSRLMVTCSREWRWLGVCCMRRCLLFFFLHAEDGIRDYKVTGVQTCALPICKTVIGNRTDVERVPIANLAVFYQKYYQPDNAEVIVAGQFDESKALALVAETFGAIPKPQRTLTQPYTAEPTQEGERTVMLHRDRK